MNRETANENGYHSSLDSSALAQLGGLDRDSCANSRKYDRFDTITQRDLSY
jgi:hypothetical protein